MKKAITVMVLVLLVLAVPVKSQEILQDQNIEMVLVEKGSFEMGDVFELVSLAVNNVHTATFTYDFYIGKYEVTFDQYDRYCQETKKATPDDNGWGRGSRPVINVSWYDAIAYCNWLSEKEGLAKAYDETGTLIDSNGKITTDPSLIEGYRLPTEAEWEYAARGGNKSKGYMLSGSDKADDVAWYKKNSGGTTHEVGTKQPNELGIYDMSGNIYEWCIDIYGWWADREDERNYKNIPTVNQCNSFSIDNDFHLFYRKLCGSCYESSEYSLYVFFRNEEYPDHADKYYGFRLARTEPHETIWEKDSNTKLKIDASQEDAQVYLNGKYIGTAPVSIDTTCMHNAQIRVIKEGYEEKIIKNVYIPKNETVQVYAELKKKEPQMILVEKGSFEMGGKDDSRDWLRKYAHKVTLTYDFYIGKYEVTHDQYYRYCEETKAELPGKSDLWDRGKRPVTWVSWYDAIGYCNWLSEKEGLAKAYDEKGNFLDKNGNITTDPDRTEGYRLPTEAEWEYAARGGNKSKGYKYSGSNNPDDVAWYGEFFITGTTHEVGTKQPNELGIYDMSGNVSEWCNDLYSDHRISSDQINPYVFSEFTSEEQIFRITRGGNWHSSTDLILNYYRWHMYSGRSDSYTGFKIVSDSDTGFRIVRVAPSDINTKPKAHTRIRLETNSVGTEVYLNNEFIGKTPLSKEVSPVHNAEIKLIQGGYEEKIVKDVDIIESKINDFYIKLVYLPPEFVLVEKGSIKIENPLTEEDKKESIRELSIGYDFYISKYEITFDQFTVYCEEQKKDNTKQYGWKKGIFPAVYMSWYEAIDYCNWLSSKEKLKSAYYSDRIFQSRDGRPTTDLSQVEGYRLATEAEWEYAARGGNKSKGYKYSGSDNIDDVGWYASNSDNVSHEVGTKMPNELGIYDMTGSVWEWCHDRYSFKGNSSDPQKKVSETFSMAYNIALGGSYYSFLEQMSPSYRYFISSENRHGNVGIRIVRTYQPKKTTH